MGAVDVGRYWMVEFVNILQYWAVLVGGICRYWSVFGRYWSVLVGIFGYPPPGGAFIGPVMLRAQQTSKKSVKQTTTDQDFRKKQTKNRPRSSKKQTSSDISYSDHSPLCRVNNWVEN